MRRRGVRIRKIAVFLICSVVFLSCMGMTAIAPIATGEILPPPKEAGTIFVFVQDTLALPPEVNYIKVGGSVMAPAYFFSQYLAAEFSATDDVLRFQKGGEVLDFLVSEEDVLWRNERWYVRIDSVAPALGYVVESLKPNILRISNELSRETAETLAAKNAALFASADRKKTDGGVKEVAMTFDDGPNGNVTIKILDILKENNIKATFFMIGPRMNTYKDIVRRIYEEGHSLGLHGMTHDYKSFYADPQSAVAEMDRANDILESIVGVRTTLVRTPYGSKPGMKDAYRDAMVAKGYKMWDWNVDSGDSAAAVVPAQTISASTTRQVGKLTRAIVLMHDKPTSAEALPSILSFIKDNGYETWALGQTEEPFNYWNDVR